MLYRLEQSAGSSADYDAGCICGKLFLYHALDSRKIAGINNGNAVYANGAAERFEINCRGGIAVDVLAVGGVVLVTGHAGDAVVENEYGGVCAVVGYVDKSGDAGVNER